MNASSTRDEDMHRFSPVICRGVCDGGQIVWANTRISQGLTGRTELPLNTAVGVPICSIGHDLYILVLFAVGIISMTPQAIEFLATVSRAVTEGSAIFLSPAFSQASLITQAKTEDFVGLWDIGELIQKYSSDVEFHLLPIGKLQKYFDCNEILLFCDFFTDFKTRRDGRFTVKQLESLRDSYKQNRKRSDSISSLSSKHWADSLGANPHALLTSSSSNTSSIQKTLSNNDMTTYSDEMSGPGVYNADVGLPIDEPNPSDTNDPYNQQLIKTTKGEEYDNGSVLHIYAQMAYKLSQFRFHEFMISILGMTVFEASELWLLSEKDSELFLVAGVYRNSNMQKWISFNENLKLKLNVSGPGRVVTTGNSHWDTNYPNTCDDYDPRKSAAKMYNVNTSFGVPLHGYRGVCGALMFYSTKRNFLAEPLLILLVERGVQLITMSNFDSTAFTIADKEEPAPQPTQVPPQPQQPQQISTTLSRWLNEDTNYPNQLNNAQQQLVNNPFQNVGYDQKLEMCRNIVNNREVDLPYPPGQEEQDEEQKILMQAAMMGRNLFQQLGNMPLNGDPNDPEVSAAFALANIGKVHWKNFLQGSNNGANLDGYNAGMKLDSNKILAIYEENQNQQSSTGLPKCKVDDCKSCVENQGASYCANHRHMRRCQKEGCNKCAQGATKYCIAHGGGRRCTFPGCFKGARDKFFCAAHGGGKRCTFEGCSKSAVGGSNLCTAHGGGKRCQFPGCTKSSQSSTKFCVRHGGGRTCSYPDCNKVIIKTFLFPFNLYSHSAFYLIGCSREN